MEVHIVRTDVGAAQQFCARYRIFATYEIEVLVYFVASILSGGNLPAYFTTRSTFMAIKSLYEPLVYPNVPSSLLVSFAFKIGK